MSDAGIAELRDWPGITRPVKVKVAQGTNTSQAAVLKGKTVVGVALVGDSMNGNSLRFQGKCNGGEWFDIYDYDRQPIQIYMVPGIMATLVPVRLAGCYKVRLVVGLCQAWDNNPKAPCNEFIPAAQDQERKFTLLIQIQSN